MDSPPLIVGSMADHVHIFCRQSKNYPLKKVIEELKTGSSKWMKTRGDCYRAFYWQSGYGAFSVSPSKVDQVYKYIENQEEHHKTITFQEEFRRFWKEYKIDYDERFVWD